METDFLPQSPHEDALDLLRGKAVVTREVFDQLLPELRARAFTITGIEAASTLQRARDAIAGIASGTTWDEAKQQLIAELDPYLGDGAATRAELLLRTHGFQAFQAANWETAQKDQDTTHLQYLTMEDDRVREAHAALNGIVLPKDDPFWEKHYPPWDWGCRCMVRTMNPDMVLEERDADERRIPENRNVIEGATAQQLRNGTIVRDGQRVDVTPPSDRQGDSGFQWHPSNVRLPLEDLQARYDDDIWQQFVAWSQRTKFQDRNKTLWQWLRGERIS